MPYEAGQVSSRNKVKTELKDRVLWFDGTNQVVPEMVPDLFLFSVPPEKIVVTHQNDDLLKFNSLSDISISDQKAIVSTLNMAWRVPKEYLDISLESYVMPLAEKRGKAYIDRVKAELAEIEKRNIATLFKSLIYIVDRFKEKKIVYGVGRGSSCASLILYLVGLHCVDPIRYGISHLEFFHD